MNRHTMFRTPIAKVILAALAVLIVAGLAIWGIASVTSNLAPADPAPSLSAMPSETTATPSVAPTVAPSQKPSESPTSSPQPPEAPNPTLSSAVVRIAFAEWIAADHVLEVSGYVSNVREDGGTCTAVVTRGSATVTGTSTGREDVVTTSCATIRIPASALSDGNYSVVLMYESERWGGTSETQEVVVTK